MSTLSEARRSLVNYHLPVMTMPLPMPQAVPHDHALLKVQVLDTHFIQVQNGLSSWSLHICDVANEQQQDAMQI